MTIRISLSTVLVALAFAVIGAGGAVGVMVWEPWDGGDDGDGSEAAAKASPTSAPEPTPTPYQKKITRPEAAAKVKITVQKQYTDELVLQSQQTPAPEIVAIRSVEECEATDFNERLRAWIVECKVETVTFLNGVRGMPTIQSPTFRLYDGTERVEPCC